VMLRINNVLNETKTLGVKGVQVACKAAIQIKKDTQNKKDDKVGFVHVFMCVCVSVLVCCEVTNQRDQESVNDVERG